METSLTVRCGNRIVYEKPVVESKWTGQVEEARKEFVEKSSRWMAAVMIPLYSTKFTKAAFAAAAVVTSADKIRQGFMQIIDVFTAIAEPILWFYAVTACILMATGKNRDLGLSRLKNVGYAYLAIALLPTFFTFLRWMARMLGGAISGMM